MALPKTPEQRIARFYANLRIDSNGCWVWTAGRTKFGYGAITIGNKQIGTHRFAWELFRTPIPEGMWVLHRCDNPPCCNPAHLFVGTPSDNSLDRDRKGRRATGGDRGSKGEKNAAAKFTAEEIIFIRNSKTIARELALEFGVHKQTIYNIKSRRTWAHLP